MKKMDVRVRRTYQMLGDALHALLKEKSFEDLTVLEICEAAGIHRATFYKHFTDKYDFLNRYFRLSIEELRFGKLESDLTPEAFRRNINRMISNVMAYVVEKNDLLHALNNENYSSVFFDILTNAVADFFLERLAEKKEVRAALGNQLPMIANYYAGATVGMIKWWAKGENTCTVLEFLEFVQPRIREFSDYLFKSIQRPQA